MTPEEYRAQQIQLMQAQADALRSNELSGYERMSTQGDFDILRRKLSPEHRGAEILNNLGIVKYFRSPSSNAENQRQHDATTAAKAKFESDADAMLGQQPAPPQSAPPQPAPPQAAPSQAAPAGPQPGSVIPRALQGSGSSASLAAPGQGTAMSYFKKYEDMMNNAPDMAAMNEYAQQRGRQGSSAMLNSLLANSAGENFAPQQAAYLKQAMAARDPLEVGGGMLTNRGFVEDPYAARGRKAESALNIGKELNAAEQLNSRIVAREADEEAKRINKTLTANQYNKLMAEADTSQVALDQLDQVLATFEVEEGGVDRGLSVWTDQITANAKTFFGKQANKDEFRLMSRDAKLQQIIGLFRTEIVGPGVVTEYDAERILKSVGGNVGALQNPDIVKEQLDILRQQKMKALSTQKRQLDYFSRSYPGLYDSSGSYPGSAGAENLNPLSIDDQDTYVVSY